MDWVDLLPIGLQEAAYVAGLERAWRRTDALAVIGILRSKGFVVLGVDVWLATTPGPTIPTPYVYDWSLCAVRPSRNHPNSAAEFVHTFDWDPNDKSHMGKEPYFNILAQRLES